MPESATRRRVRSLPPPRRVRRPRARAGDPGSRGRLFAAASAEFARHGFAGANVDRIAAAARVNKAMIYYHFASKLALYQEILGDMFHAVAGRVRDVAASDALPDDKLKRFVEAIADEAEARPHFPPIWFREIAEGGTHLSDQTLKDVASVVQMLVSILQEGVRQRRFRPVNPILVHAGIVGPLLLFFASGPLRLRLQRAGIPAAAAVAREDVVGYVQRVSLGVLHGTL